MISRHFVHKDLHVHILIDGHFIILSSKFAALRLRLAQPATDDETLKWLRGAGEPDEPADHWRCYAMEHAEPELSNVFDDSAWAAFCETHAIDTEQCYEARDIAKESGHRTWLSYLEGELMHAKMELVHAHQAEFWGLPQDEVALVDAARAFAIDYKPPPALDIERVANAAWMAQDASNLSGIVRSWAEWMPVINAHAQEQDIQQNHHAINVIMAEKVGQLAGLTITYGSDGAYAVVAKLAKRP